MRVIGAVGEVTIVVGDSDTAIAYGSGDVPVLATPRVLALAEQAAVAAIRESLGNGLTSVGIHAEIHHVKATPVGGRVTVRAELVAEEGRRLTFEFVVSDGGATAAHGTHRRVVVDRNRFTG